MRSSGTLLCLASAAAFGGLAGFGKPAYAEGATVGTLLSVRFALAAVLLWALVAARGMVRALPRRDGVHVKNRSRMAPGHGPA